MNVEFKVPVQSGGHMADLKLEIAFWNYDRTRALTRIPGIVIAKNDLDRLAIDQGIAPKRFTMEEIFVPELLNTYNKLLRTSA